MQDWPAEPNYAVGLQASADGAAPQLSLPLVSQLQLAAISPYLARVLGLYFVDTQAGPAGAYDYCLVGVWAAVVPPVVRNPGSAAAGALAAGSALFDGMRIGTAPAVEPPVRLESDGTVSVPPTTLAGTPPAVTDALQGRREPADRQRATPALLAAQVNPPAFPFPAARKR